MCIIAPVPAPMGAAHSVQGEVSLRESSLELRDSAVGEVLSPLLGQSESVIAEVRVTLEGQVLSRGHNGALRGQERGLPLSPLQGPDRSDRGCSSREPCSWPRPPRSPVSLCLWPRGPCAPFTPPLTWGSPPYKDSSDLSGTSKHGRGKIENFFGHYFLSQPAC